MSALLTLMDGWFSGLPPFPLLPGYAELDLILLWVDMVRMMMLRREHNQVSNAVIAWVFIDVVDVLAVRDWPISMLPHGTVQ